MGADIGFEPSVSADCRAVREIAGDYFGSGKLDRTGIGTDRRCKEIIEYGI